MRQIRFNSTRNTLTESLEVFFKTWSKGRLGCDTPSVYNIIERVREETEQIFKDNY